MLTRISRRPRLDKFICIILLFVFIQSFAQENATQFGVVASAHPAASKAGLQILKDGGNAVDAVIAAALVLSVVEPYASGLGGGGFLTIKIDGKDPVVIDYRETAPTCVSDSIYYSDNFDFNYVSKIGVNSIGVPGAAAGLDLALKKYGTMDIDDLVKPAIEIAMNGFEVNQTTADLILEQYGIISAFEETAKLFLNEGMPPVIGDTLYNLELAKSLELLGKEGLKSFYTSEIADAIVTFMRDNKGCLSFEDLKNYKAFEKQPVIGYYKDYQIVSTPPPSGGGTHLIELLNILENFDLHEMGLNSSEYINTFAQALSIVQSDKERFMADPAFYTVPVEQLTDKDYALRSAMKIDQDNLPSKQQPELIDFNESGSTTSLSVIDKYGNMVTLTQSICLFFGSGITIPGTGILLNNHMSDFDSEPGKLNSIEPGKRPVSSIAPTIILKDGNPFLTIGTPGGSRIIGTMAQIIVDILNFNMNLQEAIDAPRFHVTKDKLHVESRIAGEVINKLIEMGYKIQTYSEYDKYFGGAQGVIYDHKNKISIGAADPRRGGSVEGK